MKTRIILRSLCAVMAAAALLWACDTMPDPVQSTVPEASFSKDLGALTSQVNQPFNLTAQMSGEGRVTVRWYVDGVLESSSTAFNYVFPTPGAHTVRFVATNSAGEYSKEFTVTVGDVLLVELSIGNAELIERTQGEELEVSAIVIAGQQVTHEWKIDGAVVSNQAYPTGPAVVLSGKPDGSNYQVTYTAANAAGTWSKSFEVKTIELPLGMTFSPASGSTISRFMGTQFTIAATVVSGGRGLTHEWKVNGTVVGGQTTGVLTYTCPAVTGALTVTYTGTNGNGETATGTWTVNVSTNYMVTDFENVALGAAPASGGNRTLLGGVLTTTNDPGMTVVENPNKTVGNNSSNRVMQVSVFGTGSTSGFFEVILAPLSLPTTHRGVRMKIYRPAGNDYHPHMRYNGGTAAPYGTAKYTSPATLPFAEWVTVEWTYTSDATSQAWTKYQIRPLSDSAGNNITTAGTRTMYIDDIEILF